MSTDEERIALFLDYENLAIGAREDHNGLRFDLKPVADALAERGRVVVRRAYADWSYFEDDRRMLTTQHVELIEIPQRMGAVRKNAADIKMAVDAIELALERDYVTTFVIATGDSDFTPLVAKLRALNRRVIGVGLEASTSKMLPPACDEFLFYERLEGVDPPARGKRSGAGGGGGGGRRGGRRGGGRSDRSGSAPQPAPEPARATPTTTAASDAEVDSETDGEASSKEPPDLVRLVTQTLSGLQRNTGGEVLASGLKRALLRKEPTFNEADYGFRAFGELLRHLESRNVIELSTGSAKGDPEIGFPESGTGDEEAAFALLHRVIEELQADGTPPPLSGLKDQLRKHKPDFSEKEFGYGGFLQFCKAAQTRGIITMQWDEEADDYVIELASTR